MNPRLGFKQSSYTEAYTTGSRSRILGLPSCKPRDFAPCSHPPLSVLVMMLLLLPLLLRLVNTRSSFFPLCYLASYIPRENQTVLPTPSNSTLQPIGNKTSRHELGCPSIVHRCVHHLCFSALDGATPAKLARRSHRSRHHLPPRLRQALYLLPPLTFRQSLSGTLVAWSCCGVQTHVNKYAQNKAVSPTTLPSHLRISAHATRSSLVSSTSIIIVDVALGFPHPLSLPIDCR